MIEALILAATTAELDPAAGEIVVTGERISRSQHETASSVAVADGATIDALSAPDRIEQLLQMIPNVQLGSGGEGPVIRGQDSTGAVRDLPAFLSGTRPRTTVRIDGRSATYYELAFGLTSVWDVSQVEVFRTPQTTTQGRNSIGGAIFIETREPTLDWEGRARLLAGDYDTWQASGVVSGPLADDQVAFRLSGDIRRSQTASRITSAAVGIDPNRDDSELIRFKLRTEPKGLPDTRLDLTYSHGRSQMPQLEGVRAPFEDRRDTDAGYGIFGITVDSLTGRISHEPGGGFQARATLSYGAADVRRHAPPGLGEAVIDAHDFSIEPIVQWSGSSGLMITGGLNYTRATLDQSIDLTTLSTVRGTGRFADVQNSFGAFGEVLLPLASTLHLTAGLRYQRDRQVREGGLVGSKLTLPLAYDRTFTAWLPKVSLAWDISPDVRLGGLVQRASNPGGVNLNTNVSGGRVELFDDERLWDFEVFARARLAGEALTISANAFRYEMFDAQRQLTTFFIPPTGLPVPSSRIDNTPRAWTMGVEFDLAWIPSDRLELRAAAGLLDTRITQTLDPKDSMLGKQFQRSPHFSGSASLRWQPVRSVMLSASVRHNSSYFSDDRETITRRIEGSTTVDARAAWTWRSITVFGYARNLFDRFHLTYLFGNGLATAGDPREVGVGLDARF
jgi:outer membrane receptor protein involved in Fe transport